MPTFRLKSIGRQLCQPYPSAVAYATIPITQLPGGRHILVIRRRLTDVTQIKLYKLGQGCQRQRSPRPAQLVAPAKAAAPSI